MRLSKNKIKTKRAGGTAQVVEHLPSMHKALGSILLLRKNKVAIGEVKNRKGVSTI
jgi:hypothetical protein